MAHRFQCPHGHTWEAEIPPVFGETTGMLPVCPKCGEVGEARLRERPSRSSRDPTSRLDSAALVIEPEANSGVFLDQAPPLPGYQMFEEVGRGGMGVVFRATESKTGNPVAVKCLMRIDPNKLFRFKQEFRAVADLSHPNLATIHELILVNGQWCLVMELVNGLPFTDYLQRNMNLTARLEKLKPALRQLVDVVHFLHSNGLLHCDVKPTNVLVTPAGRVVLLDFGLVTEWQADRTELTNKELVGSLGYIAPERFAGKPATSAVDWYSIGVMLFETFAGRRPYEGTRTNLIWQQRYMDPPAPSEIVAELPPGWDALCIGLLERDPSKRYGYDELIHFLEGSVSHSQHTLAPLRSRNVSLVGRDRQMQQLQEAFESVHEHHPVLAVVRGRTGMGKSALVETFVQRVARRQSATILRGRCFEQEAVPYKGLDVLIDSLSEFLGRLAEAEFQKLLPPGMGTLARMFPVLRRLRLGASHWKPVNETDPLELRRQAMESLRELLSRLARVAPLILTLDDIQWGDIDTAFLLKELVSGENPPGVFWIVNARREDDESNSCLNAILQAPNLNCRQVEVAVEPLSELESLSLALTLLADDFGIDERDAATVARESQGCPVFIRELVSTIRERQHSSDPSCFAQSITLDGVIRNRFAQLPLPSQRLIEVLAIAAQPIPRATAFAAAELESEPRSALATLRTGHWIRTLERGNDQWAECFHDSVRQALVSAMPESNRIARHDGLARAFELHHPSEHVVLAAHHLGAGRPNEAAHHYARAAADAEEALAFDRAAQLLRVGMDLSPPPRDELTARWHKLGDLLAYAGRGAEAANAYLTASQMADRTLAMRWKREAAYQFCASGEFDAGFNLLRELLENAGYPIPPSSRRLYLKLDWERIRTRWRKSQFTERRIADITADELERTELLWAATAGLSMFDIVAGAYFQSLHARHTLKVGEPHRLARALAWQAAHSSIAGPVSTTFVDELLDAACSLIASSDQPYSQALLFLAEGIVRHNFGQWTEAREQLAKAEQLLRVRCRGATWERSVCATYLFWSLYHLGEYAELGRSADRLLKQALERGDRLAATNIGLFARPMSLLAANQPNAARLAVHRTLRDWPTDMFHLQHLTALISELRIDLYERHFEEARDRLDELWPLVRSAGFDHIQSVRVSFAHTRGMLDSLEVGRDRHALREAAALEGENTPAATAFASCIRTALRVRTASEADLVQSLQDDAEKLTAASLHGYAAAIRLLARHFGAEDEQSRGAREWLLSHGVVDPGRWVNLIFPSLGEVANR